MANKDLNNHKSLVFRQIELNWINAPLEHPGDYLALYLDSEPQSGDSLPVSVHKLNGRYSGKIITDYYLPQMDFYNQSFGLDWRDTSGKGQFLRPLSLADRLEDSPAAISQQRRRRKRWQELQQPVQNQQQDQPAALEQTSGELEDECLGYCAAYFAGTGRLLASNCLRTRPNWMRDSFPLISARSLPTLMVPGTHNSGTYARRLDKSVLQMINKYQLNQDDCVFDQLVFGARYLDLRVGYAKVKQRSERLWIYHDIFRTEVSLEELLQQVRRFLELTSHELVIMDFHRFTVGFQDESAAVQRERHVKLLELLFGQLGQWIIPSYLGQHAPIQEYVANGKRLLVGYAARAQLMRDHDHSGLPLKLEAKQTELTLQASSPASVRDIDAAKQDLDEFVQPVESSRERAPNSGAPLPEQQADRQVGSRIFNKLKSVKLISRSFSKRSIAAGQSRPSQNRTTSSKQAQKFSLPMPTAELQQLQGDPLARVALLFAPVRHLWPNKDTLEGLAQYMNETTCRKYFGELRSMMVELTPTVFGAISDKYDGNRRLAQAANRPVTDWIRDRWLHCINIVASDFFLGNDLVSLAIQANRMRVLQRSGPAFGLAWPSSTGGHLVEGGGAAQCLRMRKIEHLLDKSKIPIQFAYQPAEPSEQDFDARQLRRDSADDRRVPLMGVNSVYSEQQLIRHLGPGGRKILLRPLVASQTAAGPVGGAHGWPTGGGGGGGSQQAGQAQSRERRDSFVENVSESFADLFSSFRRLLNL